MIRLDTASPAFQSDLSASLCRQAYTPEIEQTVTEILADIRQNGDTAVLKYVNKFDHTHLTSPEQFRLTETEILNGYRAISAKDKVAIRTMMDSVATFARQNKPLNWRSRLRSGVVLGERFEPMQRVAIYIPGGTAPLVSTVAHTAMIANIAGVEEVVAFTPPRADGSIDPAILCALKIAGVKEVYRLGGVSAIGAAAYGTATIPKVEKIVGPGNAWVTAAKKCVFGEVAIDMIAGPSEVMVIADKTAHPEWIAADLLSQLEHGGGNHAILATPEADLIDAVSAAIPRLLTYLSRRDVIEEAMSRGMLLIKTRTLKEAADISNLIAPEHLELHCEVPDPLLPYIKAAGAIFCGEFTPEAVGDFVAGPSHVLPTAGSARWFSGLSVQSFTRRISIAQYTERALKRELNPLCRIADMEKLDAHRLSAAIRFERLPIRGRK